MSFYKPKAVQDMESLGITLLATLRLASTQLFASISGIHWKSELQLIFTACLLGGIM